MNQPSPDIDKKIEKSSEFITNQMLSMHVQTYSGGCNLVKREMHSIFDPMTQENAQLKANLAHHLEKIRAAIKALEYTINRRTRHSIGCSNNLNHDLCSCDQQQSKAVAGLESILQEIDK